jgi:osmotically-inducible protein OsmY
MAGRFSACRDALAFIKAGLPFLFHGGFMDPGKLLVALLLSAGLLSGVSYAAQTRPVIMQSSAADVAVSRKVIDALQSSKNIHAEDIRVSTRYGTVLLSGYVRSNDELLEAVLVAQSVRGVYDVKSDLLLKGQIKS